MSNCLLHNDEPVSSSATANGEACWFPKDYLVFVLVDSCPWRSKGGERAEKPPNQSLDVFPASLMLSRHLVLWGLELPLDYVLAGYLSTYIPYAF